MTRDEIETKVKKVLVDALGVDDDEIEPTSVIRDDLGAESIDFLDIMFRLEKEFGIKIPRGEMMPENLQNDSNLVKDGKLTPAGLDFIASKMPHASTEIAALRADPKFDNVSKLFTVNAIVNYVESKVS